MRTGLLILAIVAMVASGTETTWGRGFGGMHGGMRGGGFRGGGMRLGGGFGGPRMGNFGGMRQFGGMRPGGMNLGGGNLRAGNFGNMGGANFRGAGNLRGNGNNLGANRPSRSNLGPNRAGNAGGLNNAPRTRPATGRRPSHPEFGKAKPTHNFGQRDFPGGRQNGFGREARRGPNQFDRQPNRNQLGNFLGLPSDGGKHALPGHRFGPDQRGLRRFDNADLVNRGDIVRRDFRPGNLYTPGWYRRFPGAWFPGRWAYGSVWAAATWPYLYGWFGYDNLDPIYYDYGNNVTYQDDTVYVNDQAVGTAEEYYQQAEDLANASAESTSDEDSDDKSSNDEESGDWLPLGVFAMSHNQQTRANQILQLAVNKQGIIRGNYTNTTSNTTEPVQGSVDKKTQRAAWTIGDHKNTVIETGIYNLTKDEVPCLVHKGKDKPEQWMLARVNNDQKSDEN